LRPSDNRDLAINLDYDALAVLIAVCRTGSFEAAARSLNVTSSAVSQRIKQLEEKVGAVLVVRGRPCVATAEGMLLVEHGEQVALMQHELALRMNGEDVPSAAQPVTMRVAVNGDSLATWFPKVVARASVELGLRLAILIDDHEFTSERLRSGEAMGVVTSRDQPMPGCRHVPLGSMEYLAVAPPGFVAEHFAGGVTAEALHGTPALVYDHRDRLGALWIERLLGHGVEPVPHHVPSYRGQLRSCLAGAGWVMLPWVTVAPLIAEGRLAELVPGARVELALHWQVRNQASGLLNRLSTIVAEEAAAALKA
jgi:LysR family transcriptional regulator (chromosome initiation inhibitor)